MRTLVTRRPPAPEAGRSRFTPEHLQLLSDTRLHKLCGDESSQPAAKPSPFARLAMRELRRRHGPPHRPAA
jgi:hypothetical protein